jgi:U3 small nucleolar RNA-associated protein 21
LFSPSTNVDSYASGKHVRNVLLPTVSSAERSEEEESIQNSQDSNQSNIKPFVITNHQIPNMITLSLLPRSQWQSLTNLDIIKVIVLLSPSIYFVNLLQISDCVICMNYANSLSWN